ncbi:protein of unknown function [Stenotrophomonas maltophilia]|nr:protein of unknown function [Stenotrophomonas maltophilia]
MNAANRQNYLCRCPLKLDHCTPPEGFSDSPADAGQVNPTTTGENAPPCLAAPVLRRGVEAP